MGMAICAEWQIAKLNTGISDATTSRGSFENDEIHGTISEETETDLYIKDSILVFRALCKLSKKPISSEWYAQ